MFKLVSLAFSALFVLGTATAGPHPDACVCSRYAPHKGPKPSTPLTVVYTNKHYRFRFYLPQDWNGFSIVANSWTGGVREKNGQLVADMIECGPQITIRHPLWTGHRPYKDIPIMVFTHAQWKLAANEQMSVSAAPIPPIEIGRNRKYVFALPPRWSVGDELGYEEVIDVIQQNPLHTF
jgi:hypothetical protein